MLGFSRAAVAAAAVAVSIWRCCSGVCWAASCSWTNIMWLFIRSVRVSGERFDKKLLICRERFVSFGVFVRGVFSSVRFGFSRCVIWGFSLFFFGFWGFCRCYERLNKMNRYFRKSVSLVRFGSGVVGGCGG